MKGTVFQKPFEFNVEIPGESWHQGQLLKGSVAVKNHGDTPLNTTESGVALALGKVKKVKTREADAFEILQSVSFTDNEDSLHFEFSLPLNGPISDKTQCLYLIFGDLTAKEGHLQLSVEPSLTFKPLLDVLDIFFRFKLKERKHNKDCVEYKFIAPDAKEFKGLETLVLKMKEADSAAIDFTAIFNLANVGITDGNVAVQKKKETRKVSLKSTDYLFQKDSPNQDAIRKIFQDLFSDVITKQYF
ncbi:MAG: hypothetical protein CME71_12370 [Halobacteriovorax sp.]|nr:hypothetical protein [Halobacteriovorax sp.]|tara:strand:- start:553 stop:1287 length:735 start_codon:yes stop_codon:yes gene_type:complete